MTERGTRVRWTTAALLAPTAAALFTGTTVWAAGHQPGTGSTTTATPAPTATVDPQVEWLRQAVAANTAQVDALRATVSKLQKQAVALTAKTKAKAAASSSGRSSGGYSSGGYSSGGGSQSSSGGSSSSSRSSSSSGSSGGSTKVTVPAPAPAPATHTTTGASPAK